MVTSKRKAQPAILPGVPDVARYLSFSIRPDASPRATLQAVRSLDVGERIVVGVGEPLVSQWGKSLEGLRPFPDLSGPDVQVPSVQHALWCWLLGHDQGEIARRSIAITDALEVAFSLEQSVNAFRHGDGDLGLDLTGYEDGTENPTGDAAVAAAFVKESTAHTSGSSFVAVQQWVHDLRCFDAFSQSEQDDIIGRRKSDNEEIADAPSSAHTKRTEQESFEPEAFVLRRSMPFAESGNEGLMFVAFGKSFDAFEAQLRRMTGLEDGVADALFRFSRAISGAYYWCPPVREGRLDLQAVET